MVGAGVETCRAASQHSSLAEDDGAHHVHAEAIGPSAESPAEQACYWLLYLVFTTILEPMLYRMFETACRLL